LSSSDVFFQAPNATKPVFGRGSAPDPAEELTTLPQTPSQLGRGHPPPYPSFPHLRRLDLVSAPMAPRFLGPPIESSGYAYVVREEGARMIFLQGGPKFEVTPVRTQHIAPTLKSLHWLPIR